MHSSSYPRSATPLSSIYLFQSISHSRLQLCDKASPRLYSLDFIVSAFPCVLNCHLLIFFCLFFFSSSRLTVTREGLWEMQHAQHTLENSPTSYRDAQRQGADGGWWQMHHSTALRDPGSQKELSDTVHQRHNWVILNTRKT